MAKRFSAALLAACLMAGPMVADAALVGVGGKYFEITTSLTTFNNAQANLESQPWWNSETTARAFAQALGGSPYQGLQGNGDYGPLFAFGIAANNSDIVQLCSWYYTGGVQCTIGAPRGTDFGVLNYASATQVVPLPATLPLLIFGLTGLGVLGRRTRRPSTV